MSETFLLIQRIIFEYWKNISWIYYAFYNVNANLCLTCIINIFSISFYIIKKQQMKPWFVEIFIPI